MLVERTFDIVRWYALWRSMRFATVLAGFTAIDKAKPVLIHPPATTRSCPGVSVGSSGMSVCPIVEDLRASRRTGAASITLFAYAQFQTPSVLFRRRRSRTRLILPKAVLGVMPSTVRRGLATEA